MPVPTHRAGCQTRLFETRCYDCHQKVFFFSCSCDSKVFFDRKGPPWPLHRDKCIPYLIRSLRNETGFSDIAILERVRDFAKERNLEVPSNILKQLSDGSYPPTHKLQVENVAPYDDSIVVEGEVMEINSSINVIKKFKVIDNPMGKAILGELGIGNWGEITVRQMHTQLEHFAFQFTFLISQDILVGLRWRKGQKVAARIKGFFPVGRDPIWLLLEAEK